MPIRFRCAYCNQLMGIAKRKVGQVVSCPKCAGQIVVPTPDPTLEEERQEGNPAAAFEEDEEVQKLLEFVEETKPAPVASAHGARRQHAAPQQILQMPAPAHGAVPRPAPQPVVGSTYPAEVDVIPLSDGSLQTLVPARGIYLTPGVLTVMLVLIGLLIGLAFFLGFLLGRS